MPEDHSTVLLIGITKLPTSPSPIRRPYSLPLDRIQLQLPDFNNTHASKSVPNASEESTKLREANIECNGENVKVVNESQLCGEQNKNNNFSIKQYKANNKSTAVIMDQSVDSIGNCSLDVEVSAEITGRDRDVYSLC